ncbi:MAG: hypothetical protein AAGF20_00310 [Pseudomonadota bacterium]
MVLTKFGRRVCAVSFGFLAFFCAAFAFTACSSVPGNATVQAVQQECIIGMVSREDQAECLIGAYIVAVEEYNAVVRTGAYSAETEKVIDKALVSVTPRVNAVAGLWAKVYGFRGQLQALQQARDQGDIVALAAELSLLIERAEAEWILVRPQIERVLALINGGRRNG